jgi:hypothetical protein
MQQNNPSGVLTLRIMYFAMLIGMLVFSGVIYFIGQDSAPIIADIEVKKNIFLAALGIAAVCLTIASFLQQKDMKRIAELGTAKEKFEKYRSASIRTYALFEGPVLISVIGYFLVQEPRLYIIVAAIIVRYLVEFPSASKIAEKINESEEVVSKL